MTKLDPNCPERAKFALSRHRELDEAERAHVRDCAACTQALAELERWIDVARERPTIAPARSEALRARLLDSARRAPLPSSRTRGPWIAAAIGAVALALFGVFAMRGPSEPTELLEPPTTDTVMHGTVRASSAAHFTRLSDAPDEIVRLVDGTITVAVDPLEDGERFRVVIGDAEVEVRGTAFEVTADGDRLASVEVMHGRVEVRVDGADPVVLAAGQRWDRPVPLEPAVEIAPIETASTTSESPARRAPRASTTIRTPEWTAAAGFERGWNALHAGDPTAAAAAFAEVIDRAPHDPLAEDASFWRAVALSRARRPTETRDALDAFVHAYPSSPRTGEAAVMLGWLLVDQGDREGARAMFTRGSEDPSERIRGSARHGLDTLGAP